MHIQVVTLYVMPLGAFSSPAAPVGVHTVASHRWLCQRLCSSRQGEWVAWNVCASLLTFTRNHYMLRVFISTTGIVKTPTSGKRVSKSACPGRPGHSDTGVWVEVGDTSPHVWSKRKLKHCEWASKRSNKKHFHQTPARSQGAPRIPRHPEETLKMI